MNELYKLPKLYSLTRAGKIREWSVRVIEGTVEGRTGVYIETSYGEQGGRIQTTYKHISEGKNIGRSNETTPEEQAILEAESTWTKQHDKNYRTVIEDLYDKTKLNLRPMLAHDYTKRKHDIVFECYVQAKLDGLRCLAQKIDSNTIRYLSRGSKEFTTLDHLSPYLLEIMEVGDIFDGELYTDNLTFQEIVSAVKRKSDLTDKIQYHIYDYALEDTSFDVRMDLLEDKYRSSTSITDSPLVLVNSYLVENEESIKVYHNLFNEQGYEGTMIRNIDGGYVFDYRSKDLQKYKDFDDAEFRIIGGNEGVGRSEGQCIFLCETENGNSFSVRCRGSDESRKEQWENLDSYIGRYLTVRYQGLSDDGLPRFPVGISIREEFDMSA